MARYGIDASPRGRRAAGARTRTKRRSPASLPHAEFRLIATPMMALRSAAAAARGMGLQPLILGDALEGEAREMGTVMAGIARSRPRRTASRCAALPCCCRAARPR